MIGRSVSTAYKELIEIGQISPDKKQHEVVKRLDQLASQLGEHKFWKGERGIFFRHRGLEKPEQGIYLWGGVGRGKTFLMDLFFESLSEGTGVRIHFHRFMNKVHERLTALQGIENPLDVIADGLARHTKVLCFDEFYVSDIADAMLLAKLLDGLFRRGVALVTTSNIEPCELYKDGLQRERFLPAIELIVANCDVINLESGIDYRLRTLKHAELFYWPCDQRSMLAIRNFVLALGPESANSEDGFVTINRRQVAIYFVAENVIWFDFGIICGPGRAAPDYIEVARNYHTVVITGVPALSEAGNAVAKRFLHLIDEFYDRSVNLIIGANVSMNDIFCDESLLFEMDRCHSRLLEMQSFEYLERPHRPD